MPYTDMKALILRNLADFDAAARLFEEEIELEITSAINNAIIDWSDKNMLEGWTASLERPKDKISTLYNNKWKYNDTYIAKIAKWNEHEATDNIGDSSYEVSLLCGIGGFSCFYLYYNGKVKNEERKKIANKLDLKELSVGGTGNIDSVIRFQAEELALAYETNTLNTYIKNGIFCALDRYHKAMPQLEEYINSLSKIKEI